MDKIVSWFQGLWADFCFDFHRNFIASERWLSLLKGLGATLQITFFALLMGLLIGIVVAAVRSTYDKNKETMAKRAASAGL